VSLIPKLWPDEYLRQAIADELELAKAAGGYSRFDAPAALTRTSPILAQSRNRLKPAVHLPRWRRDWAAAGELIEEFGLSIRQDEEDGSVSVGVRGRRLDVTEKYVDHPDKAGAILAAIVGISIQLRAEQRDNQVEARRRWR
jgi:hypothetical protein